MVYLCDRARHLVCVPYSEENLREMADDLGIKRCWYDPNPYAHYDIPKKKFDEVRKRCQLVSPREILQIVKATETPLETSPYRLMQEEFRDDPWKLLVACVCLNLCSARVARPIWNRLFERWRRPGTLLDELHDSRESVVAEMTDLLRPLGFQNRRADRIVRLTEGMYEAFFKEHLDRHELRVEDLHGVGKYAADSYDMFVKGVLREDVQDKELKNYLSWAKEYYEGRRD